MDVNTVRFGRPEYLWLLVAPGLLVLAWLWRLARHRQDASRLKHRKVPVHVRFPIFGGLLFWLGLTLATACVIVALARPETTVSVVRMAGADIVVLQDGSASMHVEDVRGNRWRRSMAFLRVLGESLRWKDDRLAMAAFARIAAPEFRLTRDPNTFLFFLDHLEHESPFRLEDDTTWDTNLELGLAWGLRLIDKDEELNGRSPNARIFVLISDGQAWSGAVARPLKVSSARNIPLFVVGVGTTTGGLIPPPQPARTIPGLPPQPAPPYVPIRSSLDRPSLSAIATAGGGEYFELDRESDREIANRIIGVARQRSGPRGLEDRAHELYWRWLLVAAALVSLGSLTLRERGELWIQLTGIATTIVAIWMLVR
jgi:hypothetical protein